MIKIGMCFAIPNPNAVEKFMVDDIPLVVTGNSVIVFKYHTLKPLVRIETTITKKSTKACLYQLHETRGRQSNI